GLGHLRSQSSIFWASLGGCLIAVSIGRPLASRSKRLPAIVTVLCWEHEAGDRVDDLVVAGIGCGLDWAAEAEDVVSQIYCHNHALFVCRVSLRSGIGK